MSLPCLGLIALLLLCAGFYVLRKSFAGFAAFSALVIAGVVLAALQSPAGRSADAVILLAGLGLNAFGLLIVRVMLKRSVSLRLLAECAAEGPQEPLRELISLRLGDLSRHRLARLTAGTYHLTAFGRLVASMVRVSYILARVRS